MFSAESAGDYSPFGGVGRDAVLLARYGRENRGTSGRHQLHREVGLSPLPLGQDVGGQGVRARSAGKGSENVHVGPAKPGEAGGGSTGVKEGVAPCFVRRVQGGVPTPPVLQDGVGRLERSPRERTGSMAAHGGDGAAYYDGVAFLPVAVPHVVLLAGGKLLREAESGRQAAKDVVGNAASAQGCGEEIPCDAGRALKNEAP